MQAAPVVIRLGVLTVSDRAAAGVYEDLGGPEVVRAVEEFVASGAAGGAGVTLEVVRRATVPDESGAIQRLLLEWSERGAEPRCNLLLTTGGTGLAPRDVTPEATLAVVDRQVRGGRVAPHGVALRGAGNRASHDPPLPPTSPPHHLTTSPPHHLTTPPLHHLTTSPPLTLQTPGISELLLREALKIEPLAALSRAAAGIRHDTLVVNLPGRPKAVRENLRVLLPNLPHALLQLATV